MHFYSNYHVIIQKEFWQVSFYVRPDCNRRDKFVR